jgi:hypothetical protein
VNRRAGDIACCPTVLPTANRAGNGTRTRDPNLGKVVLYQLSYSRRPARLPKQPEPDRSRTSWSPNSSHEPHRDGGEGNRTPDLLNAIQALSQLSYAPGRNAPVRETPRGPPTRASGTAQSSRVYVPRQAEGTDIGLAVFVGWRNLAWLPGAGDHRAVRRRGHQRAAGLKQLPRYLYADDHPSRGP